MADSSGTHLWLVLMKAYRSMARHAQRSIAANEIGRRIQLTSGSITAAIDRLEARGLVERSADAGDRRVKKVALTRSGRALITRNFDKHKADLDDAADGLTRADRETLIALLKKLGMTADASSV